MAESYIVTSVLEPAFHSSTTGRVKSLRIHLPSASFVQERANHLYPRARLESSMARARIDISDSDLFHTVEMPAALRCGYCMGAFFQAFKDDKWLVVSKKCPDCGGRGAAPIPPAEVGL